MRAPIAAKVAKLLPLLASDKCGEVCAAAAAIGRTLKAAGADWHDLAATVANDKPPRAPSRRDPIAEALKIVGECLACAATLTTREIGFLNSIRARLRLGRALTEKQAAWLEAIHDKTQGNES